MTTAAMRLPLPAAYLDPAFQRCLDAAIGEIEFVSNFDRLCGTELMHGPTKPDMLAFVKHVHDVIYLRLPDEAVLSLRIRESIGNDHAPKES